MLRKILCFIGVHKWLVKDVWVVKDGIKYTRKCKYCGKLKKQSGLSRFIENLMGE